MVSLSISKNFKFLALFLTFLPLSSSVIIQFSSSLTHSTSISFFFQLLYYLSLFFSSYVQFQHLQEGNLTLWTFQAVLTLEFSECFRKYRIHTWSATVHILLLITVFLLLLSTSSHLLLLIFSLCSELDSKIRLNLGCLPSLAIYTKNMTKLWFLYRIHEVLCLLVVPKNLLKIPVVPARLELSCKEKLWSPLKQLVEAEEYILNHILTYKL